MSNAVAILWGTLLIVCGHFNDDFESQSLHSFSTAACFYLSILLCCTNSIFAVLTGSTMTTIFDS
jgi:hypothetical protein